MHGDTIHTSDPLSFDELRDEAHRLGLAHVGAAPIDPEGSGWFERHARRLTDWLEAGHHGAMAYLADRADERRDPARVLDGVRSALVFWLPHRTSPVPRPAGMTGRVAAYAIGRDYHNVARKPLRKLRRWLIRRAPDVRHFISIDTGPVLERAFVERAGLGWMGRSSLLVHPKLGTYGSLAVMYLDVEISHAAEGHPGRCGTCTACQDHCPTGAIRAPGVVDARRCIAYWTIEHRGVVPHAIRPTLGEWVFGCDVCQDVCPWNTHAPFADSARWRPRPGHAWPNLVAWLQTPSEQMRTELNGSPILRAQPAGLRRNALIALANGQHREALPEVERVAREDEDPVVRATAVWTAGQLGSHCAAAAAASDPAAEVRREAALLQP